MRSVRLTARADYALRAAAELAAVAPAQVKGAELARVQHIPAKFLENIMLDLKRAGLVASQRGADGGYTLAKAPADVTLADVIRAVEGPLANVRGVRPESLEYSGAAEQQRDVWIALRVNLRAVLEQVTLADLAAGRLPESVSALTQSPEAWDSH
jgi:Rrf2 family protein